MPERVMAPVTATVAPLTALFVSSGKALLQRKCVCGKSARADDQCEECKKKEALLQRRPSFSGSEPSAASPIVHQVFRSPGHPLQEAKRAFLESSFGHDFSKVTVHAHTRPPESGRASVTGDPPSAAFSPRREHIALRTADKAPNKASPTPSPARPASPPSAPAASQPSPTKLHACVTSEKIPDKRTGVMLQQGQVNDYFEMNVDWNNSGPGCDCKCGEYRQFVKGYIKVNGRKKTKPLAGGASLEENTYHEDGDPSPYGHRSEPEKSVDKFINPGRITGCSYRGKDTPGAQVDPDAHVDMSLTFKGQTYDACNGTFGKINEWTVLFNDFVP